MRNPSQVTSRMPVSEVVTGSLPSRLNGVPSASTVTVSIITISPSQAALMLSAPSRDDERRLKPPRVAQYARDMIAGEWDLIGDGIQFDSNGVRMNGQHRLHAIVMANVPIPMMVVKGLNPNAYKSIDRGVPRSFTDGLNIPNVNRAVAIARIWFMYEHSMTGKAVASDSELRAILDRHPPLADSAHWAQLRAIKGWPMAQLGFARAYTMEAQPAATESFYDGVILGANLPKHDPRLLLRNQLVTSSASNRVRLNRIHALAITIKAWNAFLSGTPLRLIKWLPMEAFPRIAL